ncbi:DUF5979 domain-containing protein [Microbacterium jejuense]|uniref:DUF5979 domain-containing protein n=1 Tax=Microbacterium jejuense TaxID=1263637 RepID=UPI0031F1690A
MERRRGLLAGLTAVVLAAATVFVGAVPAALAEDTALFQIDKSVVDPGPYAPGDPITYTITINCSSTNQGGCDNTLVTDSLPDPLIFDPDFSPAVTVQLAAASGQPIGESDVQIDTAGQSFTVRAATDLDATPATWAGGNSMVITVHAKVDPTADGTWDGATVTNTANVDADNAPAANDTADITLDVQTTLVPGLVKSVTPTTTLPALPGQAVDWTLAPSNQSNQNVDTIVVQDPIDPPADFGGYLDVTGFDIVAPPGTTATTTEYYVDGDWTETEPDPISEAGGIRVTFTGTFAPGASGSVVVHTVTNDTVTTIPDGQDVTVTNDAETTVAKGDDTSDPVPDDASITIAQRKPDVTITKGFADNSLVSGQSTTATITSTVGEQNVQTMTITEPTAGTSTFSDQGLTFNGFGDGVAWPVAAKSATITYTYSDCDDSTETTETPDTLPDPTAGCTVEGFTVVFAADGDDIVSGAYATLPMDVTANATETAVSSTNAVDTEVENTNGQTGVDDDEAPFTIDPLTLDTTVTKSITPDTIWGAPGTTSNVTLTGNVTPESNTGSDKLVISDPQFPGVQTEFWNNFTATEINNTDVPECTTLTVRYWSKSQGDWVDLTTVTGPQTLWSYDIPAEVVPDVGGIQLEYDPLDAEGCPDQLAPGFTVATNIGVELTTEQDEPVTFTNFAESLVDNPDAGGEKTDDTSADIDVNPIDGGGTGVDFLDKQWLEDTVPAQTQDVRTVRLLWSTDGLNISQMTLTDISETENPTDTAASVFDAWDLVRIDPVTTATDPLISNAVITEVSLYSEDADDWVDITDEACAVASDCDGQFAGYTLTDDEAADTLSVRFVLTEKVAGAGIGSSYDRRPFDLDFRLRDTLRSDPSQWVLGNFHPYTYNTDQAGLVDNTASAHGVNEATGVDSTDVADDTILIVDEPINAELTKEFDQDQLGLPDPSQNVDPDDYPLISGTIVATNKSAARVSGMVIDDPTPGEALADTAFDTLNLYDIDGFRLPADTSADDVTVTLSRSGVTSTYDYGEALDLEPDDLRDVTGFEVAFRSPDGSALIQSGAEGGVTLTWQLRDTLRSDPATPVTVTPTGESIENNAHTQLESPVLDDCADNQCGTGAADASDDFVIVAANYDITTTKEITPDQIYEDESKSYITHLGGRPDGTARAVSFTLTDTTDTFWNTMDFTGAQINVPAPVNNVAMDVLVGTTFTSADGELTETCGGAPIDEDSACWVNGEWVDATPGQITTFDLPSGVTDAGDVVGVRFRAQQVDENGNVLQWERPYNPQLTYDLTTMRRDTLRSDPGVEVSTTRPDLQPNPGETELGVISNEVQATSTGQFGQQSFTVTKPADDSTIVLHRENKVQITKTRGSSQFVSAPGPIQYVIKVTNTGDWNMTGFTLVDQIDTDDEGSLLVEPTPPSYVFTLTGDGAPSEDPGFSASLDPDSGLLTITPPDGFVFNAGWTLTVNASLNFRADVGPDTVVGNTATVSSDRLFETCQGTTLADDGGADLVDKAPETEADDCSADTAVTPLASATIAAKKYVKGDDAGDPNVPGDDDLGVLNVTGDGTACDPSQPGVVNDGFYSYPCAPITRPGGTESWRIDFSNTGNTNARVIAAVDTLPTVGDQGVIVPGDRGSQFPVTVAGTISANFAELTAGEQATYGIYISTVQLSQACNTNAIEVWTKGVAPDANCPFDWQLVDATTPLSTLQTARSVMFALSYENPDEQVPAPGLEPGETLRVTYETITPYVLPANSAVGDGLPIAWNSFATASLSSATDTQQERPSLITEPQKVGVAAATGQLQLSKTVEAPDYAVDVDLPDSYPMLVTCESGGEEAVLLHADGSDASRPSVPADGEPLIYDSTTGPVNLPLFSTCTVVEDPVDPGVVVTVDPEDGVIADRDFTDNTSVWDPYAGDIESASFQITNEYFAGGFTVEKSVDNGGAENQAGDDIVYDRTYTFDASCEYLGQETIPETDLTFTLQDGESKTFSDIPAGATCTVEEQDAGGAASTNITITEGDGEPVTVEEPVEFTILPYAEGSTTALTTVAFENVYTVGSVKVVKSIVDPGGWATAPFTVEMTCTIDGATPDPVYQNTHTLTPPDDLEWTVDNLPTGATCTVTEPDKGGANDSTTSVTVTVGDDPTVPVEADITNTFTVGSLQVQKQLDGAPANALDPATTDTYTVSLECTREVNGEDVDVAIPGGATRTITGAGTALYEGLPTGAECTVTETDPGFATGDVQISPDQPVTIGDGDTPVIVTVTNVFENGSVSVEKTVDAPEGFPVPESFTATVSCTWQGADVPLADDGVVTIVPGEDPVVIPDVPVGSICTVEEEDAGQTGTTVTPDSITVTDADETFALDVENTYEWASLEVGKRVISQAGSVPTQFEFHVVCTFQGETVVDETFNLDADETETISPIPARSECTVTETDDRDATATITRADIPGVDGDLAPQIDQATRTVVIPELQPDSTAEVNTVTYINLYGSTAVVLTKEFAGAGAEQFGMDETFVLDYSCTFEGETIMEGQVELNAANGWTTAVTEVVVGSECTVTEDDLNGADAVVMTPNDGEDTTTATLVIPPGGGTITVTATNWYLTGSLEVTKSFAGDGAELYGTDDYMLNLSCVRDGEAVVIPEGDDRTVDADAPTALWQNLPTGADCTLTEPDAGGANSTVIYDADGNVVAGDGEGYTFTVTTDPTILSEDDQAQPALTVENTFNLAQVSVTKTVAPTTATDINGDPVEYGPFEVELACTWNGESVTAAEPMTQTIADGETVTWRQLPEGADCTITETDTMDALATTVTITEAGATGDPMAGTVAELQPLPNVDAEDQTSVALVNEYGDPPITVRKVVDGGAAADFAGRSFTFDVRCVLIDASHPAPGLLLRDARYEVGGPIGPLVTTLPTGAQCSITEVDTGGADQTTITIDGVPLTGTTTVAVIGTVAMDIVVTNTFNPPLPATGLDGRAMVLALSAGFAILAGGVALVFVAMRRRRRLG